MLDHSAMLTVTTEKYGVFDCKPLQFIWEKFKVDPHRPGRKRWCSICCVAEGILAICLQPLHGTVLVWAAVHVRAAPGALPSEVVFLILINHTAQPVGTEGRKEGCLCPLSDVARCSSVCPPVVPPCSVLIGCVR